MAKDLQNNLNRMNPTSDDVKVGDLLQELIATNNALLAKLDADAGVTDTNYAATLSVIDINNR